MELYGRIELIREVEQAIRNAKCFTLYHDGGYGEDLFLNGEPISCAFTRVYEQYLDPKAREYLAKDDWTVYTLPTAYIRFWYRNPRGQVKIKDKDIVAVCSMIPSLKPLLHRLIDEHRAYELAPKTP